MLPLWKTYISDVQNLCFWIVKPKVFCHKNIGFGMQNLCFCVFFFFIP